MLFHGPQENAQPGARDVFEVLGIEDERATIEESIEDFDLREGLPQVTARTLVISGSADGLNPPEDGEAVAALIPQARFVVFEASGHMLPYEEADRFVSEVSDFLTAD